MKYATFEIQTSAGPLTRVGIAEDGSLVDAAAVYGAYLRDEQHVYAWKRVAEETIPTDMLQLIEQAPVSTDAVSRAMAYYRTLGKPEFGSDGVQYSYKESDVRLRAPLRPRSMRDSSCYIRHMEEACRLNNRPFNELTKVLPAHYRTSATNVAGPGDPILWPSHGTEQLDYECEFAFVMGRYGEDIPAENVGDYIFGVTLYNDVSIRDVQMRERGLGMGPVKGKNFQNSNILGPYIVTLDELDLHDIDVEVFLNGKSMGSDTTGNMFYTPEQLIEYVCQNDSLLPGEVIASGTIGPGTCGQNGFWLKEGDVVEFRSKALGASLKNTVAPKPAHFKVSKY